MYYIIDRIALYQGMVPNCRFEAISHVSSLALETDDEVCHIEDEAEGLRELVQQVGQKLHGDVGAVSELEKFRSKCPDLTKR